MEGSIQVVPRLTVTFILWTKSVIYKMQSRKNNLYSLLYLSERWRGNAHGSMYFAGQEKHDTGMGTAVG